LVRQWFALRLPVIAQGMWPIFRLDMLGSLFELQRELLVPGDAFR
jgi:hypothetical protein